MRKTYKEMQMDIERKEKESALKHGFEDVYEWRKYQAEQNRIKTYKAKIEHYEQAIAEMKAYIAEHEGVQ